MRGTGGTHHMMVAWQQSITASRGIERPGSRVLSPSRPSVPQATKPLLGRRIAQLLSSLRLVQLMVNVKKRRVVLLSAIAREVQHSTHPEDIAIFTSLKKSLQVEGQKLCGASKVDFQRQGKPHLYRGRVLSLLGPLKVSVARRRRANRISLQRPRRMNKF